MVQGYEVKTVCTVLLNRYFQRVKRQVFGKVKAV